MQGSNLTGTDSLLNILISAKDNASIVFANVTKQIFSLGDATKVAGMSLGLLGTGMSLSGDRLFRVFDFLTRSINSLYMTARQPIVQQSFQSMTQAGENALNEIAPLSDVLKNVFAIGGNAIEGFIGKLSGLGARVNSGIQTTGSAIEGRFGASLNKLDEQYRVLEEKIYAIPSKLNRGLEIPSVVVSPLLGLGESLDVLNAMKEQGFKLFGIINHVTQELAFFQLGLSALQGFVQTGPFAMLIQQNIQFQEQLLSMQSSIAATNKIVNETGQELMGGDAIKSLSDPLKEAINDIRAGSLQLVGVTSNELIETFQIITGQMGSLRLNLKDASDLTLDFAAALGTVGVPLFQQRQEIQSILTATIDINSVLAKTLNISNDQVKKWQSQGVFVEKLREKLSAFREGNALASQTVGGIGSNIKEVFDEAGRIAGQPLLEPLVQQLNKVYESLTEVNKEGQRVAKKGFIEGIQQGAAKVFAAINKLIDGIFVLIEASAPMLKAVSGVLIQSLSAAIEGLGNALKFIGETLRPVVAVFGVFGELGRGMSPQIVGLFVSVKGLQFAISTLGASFNWLIQVLPIAGDIMFLLQLRSTGLLQTFINLGKATSDGFSAFLLLGKNLQSIPGAMNHVNKALSQFKFIPQALVGPIASMIPAFASFGISFTAFAQNIPFLKNGLNNILSMPIGQLLNKTGGAIGLINLQLDNWLGKNNIFSQGLQAIELQLKQNNQQMSLNTLLTEKFTEVQKLAGEEFRKGIIKFTLGAGSLLIAFNIIDQYILKNEKVVKALQDFGLGLELILGTVIEITTRLVVGLLNPLQLLTDVMEGFKILLESLTNPVNILQTAALGLSIAFLAIIHWGSISNLVLKGFWNTLALITQGSRTTPIFLQNIAEAFQNLKESFVIFESVKKAWKDLWGGISSGAEQLWQSTIAGLGALKTALISTATNIKTIFLDAIDGIKTLVTGIWQELSSLMMGLKSIFIDVGTATSFLFKEALAGSLQGVRVGIIAIINSLEVIPGAISSTFQNVWSLIVTPLSSGVQQAIGFFQTIFTTAQYIFQNIGMMAKLLFAQLQSGISVLWEGVTNLTKSIIGGLRNALVLLINLGKNFLNIVKNIIASLWSLVAEPLAALYNSISKLFVAVKATLAPIFMQFLQGLGAGLIDIGNKVKTLLSVTESLGVGQGLILMGRGFKILGSGALTAGRRVVALNAILKGLAITLGSIAILAAALVAAFIFVSNAVKTYKDEVSQASSATDSIINEAQSSAKEQLATLEELRKVQKKKSDEYINLTEEEIEANAKAEQSAKARIIVLEEQNKAIEEQLKGTGNFIEDLFNKPSGEYAQKLQSQIEENKQLIEKINASLNGLQVKQTNLDVKGTAFQQLEKEARSARTELEKAFKSGEGSSDNLNAQATKLLDITKQQLEQGAISAEQARKNIELLLQLNEGNKLNGMETLSTEVQIKAKEQLIGTIKSEADLKASLANTELERVNILTKAQQDSVDKQKELLRLMDEAAIKALENEKIALAKTKTEKEKAVSEAQGNLSASKDALDKEKEALSMINELDALRRKKRGKWGLGNKAFSAKDKARENELVDQLNNLGYGQTTFFGGTSVDTQAARDSVQSKITESITNYSQNKSALKSAQRELDQTTKDLEGAESTYGENVKKSKEQTAEAEKQIDIKDEIETRKLRKEEVEARLADLSSEQEKALSILKNAQNTRMIVAKEAFKLNEDQLLLDQATIKSSQETNIKQIKQAQDRLTVLQKEKATEQKREKPDPTIIKNLDKQIRETQNAIQELTIAGIDNEIQATEKANQILLRNLSRRLTQERTTLIREEREGLKRRYEIDELNAKKDLEELEEKKKIGNLSKDEELALEKQIEEAKTKVFEAELATRKAKLEEQNQILLNQITAQNQQLEKQSTIIDAIVKLQENQVELAKTRQNLQTQHDSLIQTEINVIAEGERTEFRKKRLAELSAALRLEALKRQQKFELESFDLEQKKQELLLEREQIQNRINQGQAEADLAKAKADAEGVKIDPRSTQAQIRAADLQVQAAQSKLEALSQEAGFISQQRGILQETSGMELQRIKIQQKEQLIKAQGEAIAAVTSPGLRTQLQNQMGDNLARELGAIDRNDLANISGRNLSRQILSNEFGVSGYRPISDIDPSLEDLSVYGNADQQRRARQQAELNYLQQTGGDVPNGVVRVVPQGRQLEIPTLEGVSTPSNLENSMEQQRLALENTLGIVSPGLRSQITNRLLGDTLPQSTIQQTFTPFNNGVDKLTQVLTENTNGLKNLAIALEQNKTTTQTKSTQSPVTVNVTGNNLDQIINRAMQLSR